MFRVRDKVRIRKESRYYSRVDGRYSNGSNPIDVMGVVTEIQGIQSQYVVVRWYDNCQNSYGDTDLELIKGLIKCRPLKGIWG